MKTLYVSDLDGTLLQPDARLSAETIRMLNTSIERGKLFTCATARTPATVAPILKGVNMQIPAIVMTGAAWWDTHTGYYSNLRLISEQAAAKLIDTYRSTNTPTFVYFIKDNLITIRHIGPLSDIQQEFINERSHTPFKRIEISPDGSSIFPEHPDNVVLLYSMLPNDQALRCLSETRKIAGVRPQFYHDFYGEQTAILEAFASDATKANAMRRLAEHVGADRIVAFGDNINDLPMMKEADLAVAVDNALDEVKEAADIVIGPNTENSVVRFILEN